MSTITLAASGPGVSRRRPPVTAGRLRLTRRGRVVLVLLMAVVVLLAARVGTAVAGAPGEPVEVRVHVVSAGETLWGLAEVVAEPGEDLRDVVGGLVELNELSSAGLQVGQRVLLPVGGG